MPATLDVPGVRPDEDWWPPLSWSLGSTITDLPPLPHLPDLTDERRRAHTGPRPGAAAAGTSDPLLVQVCWPRLAGHGLLVLGGLLVTFAAFQLWGTSLIEWRTQHQLSVALATHLESTSPLPLPGPTSGPAPAPAPTPTPGSTPAAIDGASLAVYGESANAWAEPAAVEPAPATAPTPATAAPGAAGAPRLPAAPLPALAEGDVVGRIEIPAIGLSKVFLEGVGRDTLRRGPGLYPTTALPGHRGTTAMAGHRTTHGAPFFALDRLEPGDQILIETVEGRFEYLVEAHPAPDGTALGHRIVRPDAIDVLADNGQNRLTLTACHPRYSAEQRIVVTAVLVGPPLAASSAVTHPTAEVPATVTPATVTPGWAAPGEVTPGVAAAAPGRAGASTPRPAASAVDASLGWQKGELEPTLLWATITLLVSHGGWILGRMWRPRVAWAVTAPAVVCCLFVCFTHVDRLIPAL